MKLKNQLLKLIAVLCLTLLTTYALLLTNIYAEGTVANTVIQNGGDAGTANTADTAGDTVVQWLIGTSTSYTTCSQISVTVSTGYAIATLPTPSDQTLTPGSTAYYAYTAYNIGNATDTFTLSASTYAGQGWSVKIYKDDNADGVHQDSETTEVTNTGLLVQDTTYYFFLAVFIPASATDAQYSSATVTVKNQNGSGAEDNWQVDGNDTRTDNVNTVCSAVSLQVVKGSDVKSARPFTDTIIYTSTITATGSATANNVIYRDKLPAECEYVAASIVKCIWATGGERVSVGDGEAWDSGNQLITVNLGDLTAGTSAYVEFKVTVK